MLAVTSLTRSTLAPEVPTIAEQGFPGYEGVLWIGLMGPKGVPAATIDLLAAAMRDAVRSEALAARLRRDGIEPVGDTAAEFRGLIGKEVAQWRELGNAAQISID